MFFGVISRITSDDQGRIYVLDALNVRVQIFDASGLYLDQFGTPGSGDGGSRVVEKERSQTVLPVPHAPAVGLEHVSEPRPGGVLSETDQQKL